MDETVRVGCENLVSFYFSPKRPKTTPLTVISNFCTKWLTRWSTREFDESTEFANESTESTLETSLLPSQLGDGE